MSDSPLPEPSPRASIIAFVIIAIAILGGGALLLASRPQPVQITINPPLPTATSAPTFTPGPITVYITGAVAQPEILLTLPAGTRIEAAIEAAGGVLENADLERVNLAAILRDGDQVHVPQRGQETILPTPGGSGIIYINTATVEELTALPGIGTGLAQRIIDYREANGFFDNLDALDAVPGIGPALLEAITPLISFEGS